MNEQDEVVGFFGTETFSWGQSRALALRPGVGVWPLAMKDAVLLSRCQAFRTLTEHARAVCQNLGWDTHHVPGVRRDLERLAQGGLLIRRRELLDQVAHLAPSPPPPRLERLAVITRNRPESLAECLDSYLSNMREHSRSCRILVSDATDDASGRRRNQELTGRSRDRFGFDITYAGPDSRRRYASLVANRAKIPEDVAHFAWSEMNALEVAPGRNRNFVLAAWAGSSFVSVDDDTRCVPARPSPADPGRIVFSVRSDPTDFWFFPDRESVLRQVQNVSVDYLGLHEGFLGRQTLSGLDLKGFSSIDLESPDCLIRWLRQGEGTIRVTQTGLYGDSGIGSPAALLGVTGASWDRMTNSEASYRAALTSRQVIRSALSPVVSGGGYFMAYSAGFDNRQVLPPFMPVYRGEDDVFLQLLRKCMERDRIAHVPWTIGHSPPEKRLYVTREDGWRDACATRMKTLVVSSVAAAGGFPSWSADRRLEVTGRHLIDLGSMPVADFKEFLRRMIWDSLGRWVRSMEERLEQKAGRPESWAQDVRAVLAQYASMASSEDLIRPADLTGVQDPEEAARQAQEWIRKFGQLVVAWPSLWEAARDLGESALEDATKP